MRKSCFIISDEWKHEGRDDGPSSYIRKVDKIKVSSSYGDEKLSPTRYRDNPPSYIFPKEPMNDFKGIQKFMEKSLYRKQLSHEEDPPIVVKKQVKDSYIHESPKKHYPEAVKAKAHVEEDRMINGGLMRQQSERYRHHASDRIEKSKYIHSQSYENYDKHERENLTDRQKYREIIESKKYQQHPHETPRHEIHRSSDYRNDPRDYSPEHVRTIQRKSKSSDRFELPEKHVHERNKHKVPEDYIERNPYREPDSLPYHESIENMMKSPVMKYKSRIPYERSPSQEMYPTDSHGHGQRKQSSRKFSNSLNQEREVYIKESSPMSTMKRTSPKDRFHDAKEKFQAMEKIRLQHESRPVVVNVRRSEPTSRYEKDYRPSYSPEPRYPAQNEWSSEEEFALNVREYREGKVHQRHQQQQQRYMAPAKSLGNLTKGYRHSYAEPTGLKYCNRVGLAAIEPY